MEILLKKERKKRGPYKKKNKILVVPESPKVIECYMYYVEEFNDSHKIVFMDLNNSVHVINVGDKPFPVMNLNKHLQIQGNENKVISHLLVIEKNNVLPVYEL